MTAGIVPAAIVVVLMYMQRNRKKDMMPDGFFAPFAQSAYEAYKRSTGGKTLDGRDMPTWEQIGEKTPHVQLAWIASVKQIFFELQIKDALGDLYVDHQ